MSITVENVKIEKTGSFFTNAAGNLPMSMASPSITGVNVGSDPNVPLTSNDYYNMMQRDKAILQTLPYVNFTNSNMSITEIDSHMSSKNGKYFGSNYNANNNSDSFENPFKPSELALSYLNRYKMIYKNAFVSFIDIAGGENNGSYVVSTQTAITESLFNPLIAVNTIGMMENVPLINAEVDGEKIMTNLFPLTANKDGISETSNESQNLVKSDFFGEQVPSTSDCSIKTLVKLSEDVKEITIDNETNKISKMGMARYKWADFMYCKDLGKYSNNMLITLRKFPHPIGDNIFSVFGYGENANDLGTCPDVGRMVAWLGDENKLEDICKFNYSETWKPLNAEAQQEESKSDNSMLGNLFNLGNPQYMKGFREGKWGSSNTILGRWSTNANTFFVGNTSGKTIFSEKGTYEGVPSMTGQHYDDNKVYTKQGTVQETHIYEGKLQFTQSFSLTFNYQLRAYENINPKSAFLDLIANILTTTYRKGEFWGGSRSIYGAPGNNKSKGWEIANTMINSAGAAAGDATEFLLNLLGGKSPSFDAFYNKFKANVKTAGDALTGGKDINLKNIVPTIQGLLSGNSVKIGNIFESFVTGSLKNGLGRPAVYAFKSLLSGEPVGLWHVTIGNPRNPIMAMGNLIIEGTDFQLYGPLGIDDFPSGIKVTVNLKHAKPRDAAEIANMFTRGETTIGFKLIGGDSLGAPEKYLDSADNLIKKFGTKDKNKIIAAMASAF